MVANQPEYLSRIGEYRSNSRWVLRNPIIFSPIWQEFPERFKEEKDFKIILMWDLYLHHLDPSKAVEFRKEMINLIESSTLVSDGPRKRFSDNRLEESRSGLRAKIYQAVMQYFFSTNNGYDTLLTDQATPEVFFDNPVNLAQERSEIKDSTAGVLIPIVVIAIIYVLSMMFREPEANTVPNVARLMTLIGQILIGTGVGFGAGGIVGGALSKSARGGAIVGTIGGLIGAGVGSMRGVDMAESMPTQIESIDSVLPEMIGLLFIFSAISAAVYRRRSKVVRARSSERRNHVANVDSSNKRDIILQSITILVLQKLKEIEQNHTPAGRVDRSVNRGLSQVQTAAISQLYEGVNLDHLDQVAFTTAISTPELRPDSASVRSTGVATQLIQDTEAYAWLKRQGKLNSKPRLADALPSIQIVKSLTIAEKIALAELVADRYKKMRFNKEIDGNNAVQFDILPTAPWFMLADAMRRPDEERLGEYLIADGVSGRLLATSGPAAAISDSWYQGVTLAGAESQMQLRAEAFQQLSAKYRQVHAGGRKDAILATPPAIKKVILEGMCLQAVSTAGNRGSGHQLEPFLVSNIEPYAKYNEAKLDDVALIELFLADTLPSITNPYGSSQKDLETTAVAVRSFRIRYIKKVLDAYLPRDTESLKKIVLSSDCAKKFSLVVRILMESVENEAELNLIINSLTQFNASIDGQSGVIRRTGEFFESSIFTVAIVDVYNFIKKRKVTHDSELTKRAYQEFAQLLESMISTIGTEMIYGASVVGTFPFNQERIGASLFSIPYALDVLPDERRIPLIVQLSAQVQAATKLLEAVLLQNQVASNGGAQLAEGKTSLDRIIVIQKISTQVLESRINESHYSEAELQSDLARLSPTTLQRLNLLTSKGKLVATERASEGRRKEIIDQILLTNSGLTDLQNSADEKILAQIKMKLQLENALLRLKEQDKLLTQEIREKRKSITSSHVMLRSGT